MTEDAALRIIHRLATKALQGSKQRNRERCGNDVECDALVSIRDLALDTVRQWEIQHQGRATDYEATDYELERREKNGAF
jgi:hypothetical protein